jgi:hypothetical protein
MAGSATHKLVTFRAPPEHHDLIAAMARRDELCPSAWLREVIAVISSSGLTLPQLMAALGLNGHEPNGTNGHHPAGHRRWTSPNPKLGATIIARTCQHPTHLITRYATFDRCKCGRERPR